MEDENKVKTAEEASAKSRRTFVKGAAKVAVTAPAVMLLLSATTKSHAQVPVDPYCEPNENNNFCRPEVWSKKVATIENDKQIETTEEANAKSRRAFVNGAAKAAVSAPAVVMLLNAATKSASANPDPYINWGAELSGKLPWWLFHLRSK